MDIPAISRTCHLRAIAKPIRLGQQHFDPAGAGKSFNSTAAKKSSCRRDRYYVA
jgi:hypothetical protein